MAQASEKNAMAHCVVNRMIGSGKQSKLRERIKRMLRSALPDFDFDRYPVLALRPYQREGDRPAWSVVAIRKSDELMVDVYSQETMTETVFWGLKVFQVQIPGRSIWVGADMPDTTAEWEAAGGDRFKRPRRLRGTASLK